MPRMCSVCAHPKRWEIDQLLVTDQASNREVARRYNLSASAVDRHKKADLPAQLATIVGRLDALEGEQILGTLGTLYLKAMEQLSHAEAEAANGDGGRGIVLRAIKEARQVVESMAKVSFVMSENPSPREAQRLDLDRAIEEALERRSEPEVLEAEEITPTDEVEMDLVADLDRWEAALARPLSIMSTNVVGIQADDDEVEEAEVIDDEAP